VEDISAAAAKVSVLLDDEVVCCEGAASFSVSMPADAEFAGA